MEMAGTGAEIRKVGTQYIIIAINYEKNPS